ncbi:hypothetical protein [Candidatus Contendibacter odensensis]|uniref:hypothetical protein n=1 Tax=Candidatus Contendibacter odensensis TaxID=1400860 RepID=UPI0004B6A77A|nr:hypothetical protein [Candidatus Contendobacter odensis]
MHTETLATHALAHLEDCFAKAYDKKIHCPACGKRIVEDVVQHTAAFEDGDTQPKIRGKFFKLPQSRLPPTDFKMML